MKWRRTSDKRSETGIRPEGAPHSAQGNKKMLPTGIGPFVPAGILLAIGIVGLSLATFSGTGVNDRYIVFAAPGSTLADTINLVRDADGRLVQIGRYPNIVIAGSHRPDFAAALRRSGAWLAITAPARGGCIDPLPRKADS